MTSTRSVHYLIRSLTALLVLASLLTTAAPAYAAPSQISYVLMPHPDDEYSVWSLVSTSGTNYKVFIYLTQGEETAYCSTDAWQWYQGPNMYPNPNYGEIHPHPQGSWIWNGKFLPECEEARMNGTRRFLSDKALADASIPTGFSLRGTYTLYGNTLDNKAPERKDGTKITTSRSARVYNASNGMGKVIFLDLGDGDLTRTEVEWAVRKVREYKSTLGIPTNLPEYNVVGAFSHVGGISGCQVYNHPDHRIVHEALWNYDMISGRQHGRTCSNDSDHDPGRTKSVSLSEHDAVKAGSFTTRVGPFQRRYGWLAGDWWSSGWSSDQIRGRTQYFWSRFS